MPLARLLKASTGCDGRVGEAVGRSGLPALLVEVLRHPRASVVLPALEALREIYAQHHRPKARIPSRHSTAFVSWNVGTRSSRPIGC